MMSLKILSNNILLLIIIIEILQITNTSFIEATHPPTVYGSLYGQRSKRQIEGVVNPYCPIVPLVPNATPYAAYRPPETDLMYDKNQVQFRNRYGPPQLIPLQGYPSRIPYATEAVTVNDGTINNNNNNNDDNEENSNLYAEKRKLYNFPPNRVVNKRDLIRPAKPVRLPPPSLRKAQQKTQLQQPCACTNYGPREIFGY